MSEPKIEYQISRIADEIFVYDSTNQELVGVFETYEQAQKEIARERLQDAIWERTQELVRHAVVTLMSEFNVTQEAALCSVNSALGITSLGMDGKARP